MAVDAELVLLNRSDLGSDNDGTGSGSDETTAGGAVIDVDEGAELAFVLHLSEADSTAAVASETFDLKLEISPDNSSYGTAATFRQFTASAEVNIDESAGDVGKSYAIDVVMPLAASGQSGKIKARPVTVASTTAHWAIHVSLMDRTNIRQEWYDNAHVAA